MWQERKFLGSVCVGVHSMQGTLSSLQEAAALVELEGLSTGTIVACNFETTEKPSDRSPKSSKALREEFVIPTI